VFNHAPNITAVSTISIAKFRAYSSCQVSRRVGVDFQQPPISGIGEFLPVSRQSGNGYYLEPTGSNNGALGQYTIIANADVFGSDAGTYTGADKFCRGCPAHGQGNS
jgi:hypothetical protein